VIFETNGDLITTYSIAMSTLLVCHPSSQLLTLQIRTVFVIIENISKWVNSYSIVVWVS